MEAETVPTLQIATARRSWSSLYSLTLASLGFFFVVRFPLISQLLWQTAGCHHLSTLDFTPPFPQLKISSAARLNRTICAAGTAHNGLQCKTLIGRALKWPKHTKIASQSHEWLWTQFQGHRHEHVANSAHFLTYQQTFVYQWIWQQIESWLSRDPRRFHDWSGKARQAPSREQWVQDQERSVHLSQNLRRPRTFESVISLRFTNVQVIWQSSPTFWVSISPTKILFCAVQCPRMLTTNNFKAIDFQKENNFQHSKALQNFVAMLPLLRLPSLHHVVWEFH